MCDRASGWEINVLFINLKKYEVGHSMSHGRLPDNQVRQETGSKCQHSVWVITRLLHVYNVYMTCI